MTAKWPQRRLASVDAPEHLCRFVAAEWPGGLDEWRQAAMAWLDETPGRRLPFGRFGDALDVIRESARLKKEERS